MNNKKVSSNLPQLDVNIIEMLKNYQKYFNTKTLKNELFKIHNPSTSKHFAGILLEIDKLISNGKSKRLRPFLATLGYMYNNESHLPLSFKSKSNNLQSLSFALEMYHTSALIWDDIIDIASERRGEPTIETIYHNKHQELKIHSQTKNHYGMSNALLAGGAAMSYAEGLIAFLPTNTKKLFFEMSQELFSGQCDDSFGVGLEEYSSITEQKIITMMETKSGNYSIYYPFLLGLSLKKSKNSENNSNIKLILKKIGLLFQLTDDLIGSFGNSKNTGKSIDSDIAEKKRTILMLKTFKNTINKKRVELLLGDKKLSPSEISYIREEMVTSGAREYVETMCHNIQKDVTKLISNLKRESRFYQQIQILEVLDSLTLYLLTRTY